MHHYQDLITIFNECFFKEYNTLLIRGEDEPLYVPANEERSYHSLYFAHGYFASALHECSHWLIAGKERRLKEDFGYWYIPDGRSSVEQTLFQTVEVKPQALEWILSKACEFRFLPSIDNLNGESQDTFAFKKAVYDQVIFYCEQGLPRRAALFRKALCKFYKTPELLVTKDFSLEDLL